MPPTLQDSSRFAALVRLVVLVGSLWPAWAPAATFYVDDAGSAGNSCFAVGAATTPSQRRPTIAAGMQCLAPGDTLVIFPHSSGAYNQCIFTEGDTSTDISGSSWETATTIRASTVGAVELTATTCDTAITVINESYLILDGFVLNGTGAIGSSGISGNPGSHHIRIQNVEVKFFSTGLNIGPSPSVPVHWQFLNVVVRDTADPRCNPPEGPGCTGAYIHTGDEYLFDNVTIYNTTSFGIQFSAPASPAAHGTVTNSTFHSNPGGIAGSGLQIYNSVFYNNGSGLSSNGGLAAIGNTFYNHSNIALNLQAGAGYIFQNNIFIESANGATLCHFGDANCLAIGTFQANLCTSTSGIDNSGCTATGSATNTFASTTPGAGNFLHLKAGSPAIGLAVATGYPEANADHTGATRDGDPDVGAYEFGATTAGPPAALAFGIQPPASTVASTVMATLTVQVLDAGGAMVATASDPVTLALGANPGGGTLSCGPATCTRLAVAGTATFDGVSLSAAGVGKTLVATASGLTSATSTAFTITPPVPAKLAFGAQPSPAASGVAMSPAVTVTVLDAAFNFIPTSTIPITMALQQGPVATLNCGPATCTKNAVAGVATFDTLSIATVGTDYTLRATSSGVAADQSDFFEIRPAGPSAATQLAFGQLPTDAGVGASLAPPVTVLVRDAAGLVVTASTAAVTVALAANPAGGTLSCGPATCTKNAVAGEVTFDALSLNLAGTGYRLGATAAGLTAATSAVFTISPAPPPPTDLAVSTTASGFFLVK